MDAPSSARTAHLHRLLWPLLLALTLLWLLGSTPVHAAPAAEIIYVDDDPAITTSDGITWTTAYTDLQSALGAAVSGDEIWAASGVYTPGAGVNSTFVLAEGVALYGGFAGTEDSRDERDWETNVTVLSGDLDDDDTFKDASGVLTSTAGLNGTNAYHVVTGSGVTTTAVLDGFTITAGDASGDIDEPCEPACGGGMFNASGSPTLANLIFSGNRALISGGGMYNVDSSPSLTGVTFTGNQAEVGAGMHNSSSSPTLDSVTFLGNDAIDSGGGVSNDASSPTLTNVIFTGNRAENIGGGMANGNLSSPSLVNVTFTGNRADAVTGGGGGIHNDNSSPTLTNVTLSGNQANSGGGMYNETSSPLIQNSILWGNNSGIVNANSTISLSHSLVQGQLGGSNGNLDGSLDPSFVEVPSCGGDGVCTDDPGTAADESADDAYGDLSLQVDSPAIDQGNNNADLDGSGPLTVTVNDVATDLAGIARIVAVRVAAPTVDLGAYELGAAYFTSTPVVTTTEGFTYTYAITAAHPVAGQPLTLTVLATPAWLTFTTAGPSTGTVTGTLSGTPSGADVGTSLVALQVEDGNGITVTQSFTLTVLVLNLAPSFASTPVLTATNDVTYTYAVSTTDPNVGDTRTITATTRPAWLTLTDQGDGSATLAGFPTNANLGLHPVTLVVEDSGGLTATQSFTIAVFNTIHSPIFTSAPVLTATQGSPYLYAITTSDANVGEPLTLTAELLPTWLTFTVTGSGKGRLTGTPGSADVGDHAVLLKVQDPGGLAAFQPFTLTVIALPGGSVTGRVIAGSGGELNGVAGVTVTISAGAVTSLAALPEPAVTNAFGVYRFDGVPPGTYILIFTPPPGFALPGPNFVQVTVAKDQTRTLPDFIVVPVVAPEEVDALYLPHLNR